MDLSKAINLVPSADGVYISEEQRLIAQVIHDYDDTLDLVYIPPDKRVAENLAWAVICEPRNAPSYIFFYAEKCDQRIIERIYCHDNARTNVLTDLEKKEMAWKALREREWLERNEAAADIGAHAMGSPLNWYKYKNPNTGKLVTVRN